MFKWFKFPLISIIIALCLFSALNFSLSSVNPTEYFHIYVISNGDVQVKISTYHVKLPEEFPRIPIGIKGSNCIKLTYNIGGELTGQVFLDLIGMSEVEADAEFQRIKDFLEGWLKCKFDDIDKLIHTSQYIDFWMWVEYDFKAETFNPDILLDKFMSLIPHEGFLVLVGREIISPGDQFSLTVYGGSNYAQLTFIKTFKNYFDFKVGETYTLDVFELFNFKDSIKIPNSQCEVKIILLYHGSPYTGYINTNIQFQIVKLDLPYNFSIGRPVNSNSLEPFTIINFVNGKYTLHAGQTIEYMRITFRIIEAGLSISTGMLIAVMLASLLAVIILIRTR